MQLVCCPARRGCSRKFCTAGLRTMLAVQFRTTGTRTMLAGECPLIGAPISEWASRLEDGASPLRIAAMPSRFSFARSSTYRKGSPGYRRAFSAYVNSLYMRHADDARVSSAQPACGRCSRYRSGTAGSRTMLAGECPLFSAWGRFEDGAPATHVRYAASYTAPLQAQLAQIAFRNRLHLVQAMHTTQRLCPGITRRFRTHRQTGRRPQHTDHRSHRIRIRIH